MPLPYLLVVDDGPEIGLIVQRLGKRAGQEVVCRADATSAWELPRQTAGGRRPDLVLLDLNLPDLPGVELCRRLRATAGLDGVPVALFTNWDQGREIAVGLEAGARFVVCKDLLPRPEAWQARLADVLAAAAPRFVAGPTALSALRQALRHPTLRPLGPEVLGTLVRRALRQTRCPCPAEVLLDDLPAPATSDGAEPPAALAAALAEQVWCVLGTADSVPFRTALGVEVARSAS